MTKEKSLEQLKLISCKLGQDLNLIQGAGGNTSIKIENTLWVKASGTCLEDAQTKSIFVPVDLAKTRAILQKDGEDFSTCLLDPNIALRPSIETSLHALLPQRVVLHVHSVHALALACRHHGQQIFSELLQQYAWSWIPYCRPGLPLTHAIQKILQTQTNVEVLILQNHGMVVMGDSVDAAYGLLQKIEHLLIDYLNQQVGYLPRDDKNVPTILPPFEPNKPNEWRVCDYPEAQHLANNQTCRQHAAQGVLYPDHVVFLGTDFSYAKSVEHLSEISNECVYAVIPNDVVMVRNHISKNAEAMLFCLSMVCALQPENEPMHYLSNMDIDALLNWDAEKYRQQMKK